jgi:DNA-binding LacI/PurR family transcriptional regulator
MSQSTIKDIARELNISPSTVSRALSDHPDISLKTKKKVRDWAEKLSYQPNSMAQNLKKKSSNIIGVIVPQVKHYFFAAIMGGITDIAYDAGYTVMICQSNENMQREIINTHALISHRVAGLLISVSQVTSNYEHFIQVQQRGIPIVFFDRACEEINASRVVVNDYGGAFSAVQYLIQSGYKRIAHLAGPEHLAISKHRFDGYCDALKAANLPYAKELIVFGGLNEEDGATGYNRLLEQTEAPDAIFCVTDPVAIGAFSRIRENGFKIPDDIALVGFSDNPTVSLIEPPLTTVRQPAYEIGKTAASLLLEQIKYKNKKFTARTITLETELIIRKST